MSKKRTRDFPLEDRERIKAKRNRYTIQDTISENVYFTNATERKIHANSKGKWIFMITYHIPFYAT